MYERMRLEDFPRAIRTAVIQRYDRIREPRHRLEVREELLFFITRGQKRYNWATHLFECNGPFRSKTGALDTFRHFPGSPSDGSALRSGSGRTIEWPIVCYDHASVRTTR